MTWRAPEVEDTRPDLDMTLDERATLLDWLELYRATVPLKVAGLTGEELCRASVPGSSLSLLGVVRHLAEVERYWCTDILLGQETPDLYSTRDAPEACFDAATAEGAEGDLRTFAVEVKRSRRHITAVPDLGTIGQGLRHGEPVSLRWIVSHLVEEYARHLGHMDMLRGAIDGRTGY